MEITINILGLDNLTDAINHFADSFAGQVPARVVQENTPKSIMITEGNSGEFTMSDAGTVGPDNNDTAEDTKEVTFSLEEVRAKLTELTRAGKQKEVKDLITSFGAKNVTSIDPKDYAALMEKAGTL